MARRSRACFFLLACFPFFLFCTFAALIFRLCRGVCLPFTKKSINHHLIVVVVNAVIVVVVIVVVVVVVVVVVIKS